MYTSYAHRCFSVLIGYVFLFLLAACGSVGSKAMDAASKPGSTSRSDSPAGTTVVMPPTQTSCPAFGKARAAVLPPVTFGIHSTIVYVSNSTPNNGVPGTSTLLRYDVTTSQTTQIVQFAQTVLSAAQVSGDGHWVLFDAENATVSKLQLIRLDGKYLQTLYCLAGGTSGNGLSQVLWSPDQKHIVFAGPTRGTVTPLYLLTMQSGNLQVEATLDSGSDKVIYILRTWLDNRRVYVSDLPFLGVPTTLYLLDISKGVNQRLGNLAVIFRLQTGGTYGYFDFDRSANSTRLFLTQTAFDSNTGPFAPSTISSQPAAGGGTQTTLYSSRMLVIQNLRVLSSRSLLLRIESSSTSSQNGLWKINTDGTALTRLTTEASGHEQSLSEMAQTPWSDISRDGSRYVLVDFNLQGKTPANSLLYGSLSGGSLTTFVSFTDGTNVNVAGWTSM
jgi:eukaryotic-like serine/threonine-protein kinase